MTQSSSPPETRDRQAGRPSLHPEIHSNLKKLIESRGMKPGEQLDSEAQLCRRFGVSRPSVRKALQQLAREGLIVSMPGKGHFISDLEGDPTSNGVILCVLGTHNPEALYNDSYSAEIIAGLQATLTQTEHRLLFEAIGASKKPTANLVANHVQNLVGLVVVPLGDQTAKSMLASTPSHIPRVVIGRPSHKPAIPSVYIDHRDAMYRATQYLLDLGHENIALLSISSAASGWAGTESAAGYQAAMRSAGLDEQKLAFNNVPNSPEASQHALRQVLSEHPEVTAMIIDVFQDTAALRKLEALQVKVPDDLSLVLVDDTEAARYHNPPITVVREPAQSMGRLGGEMLVELLAGRAPTPRNVQLASELIVRNSARSARSSNATATKLENTC